MSEENKFNLPPKLLKRYTQFKKIDNREKFFERIIALGKKLAEMPESLKIEDNQVKGCASLTFISGRLKDNGTIQYQGDSNSHLVKGLVALLVECLNEEYPIDILKINPEFITDMGLKQALTASRANGFLNTYSMMMEIARHYA